MLTRKAIPAIIFTLFVIYGIATHELDPQIHADLVEFCTNNQDVCTLPE